MWIVQVEMDHPTRRISDTSDEYKRRTMETALNCDCSPNRQSLQAFTYPNWTITAVASHSLPNTHIAIQQLTVRDAASAV